MQIFEKDAKVSYFKEEENIAEIWNEGKKNK